jgi:hypothetical protein
MVSLDGALPDLSLQHREEQVFSKLPYGLRGLRIRFAPIQRAQKILCHVFDVSRWSPQADVLWFNLG